MHTVRRQPALRAPQILFLVLAAALLALSWAWWSATRAPAAIVRSAAERQAASPTDRLAWSYQDLVRAEPDNLDAAAILGELYLQLARERGDPGYYGKAEALFQRALSRDPEHLPSLIGQGSLLLAQHRFAEALTVGERAQRLYPAVARVRGVVADAQVELGLYDQAVASVQAMVDMRPDLASYSRVAYLRELHGDTEGAIEAMTLAVRAQGPTLENTEWARVQLGNLYAGAGDLERAERVYAESLERLPGYVHALAGMARVRTARGQLEEARALYEEAVARMPLPEFVVALGELHEATGRTEEAQRQYALVGAMLQLFQAERADIDLELALFEADHGNPQRALALARAAYERRPGIRGAEALAWALHRAGRSDEARPLIAEAMRLGTQDAVLYFRAAMIARASGDTERAHSLLEQARAISPVIPPLYAAEAELFRSPE